jgi:hypothetical protein
MESLGYKDRPHPFAVEVLGLERSDKIQNIASHRNRISTEILVLITTKVVNAEGQKVNGNWLLTGEGPMFLSKNHTQEIKPMLRNEKDLELGEQLKIQRARIYSLQQDVKFRDDLLDVLRERLKKAGVGDV